MKNSDRILALRNARKLIRSRDRKLESMKRRLAALTTDHGVELESDIVDEITDVIQKHRPEMESLAMSDFRSIFWNQQVHE